MNDIAAVEETQFVGNGYTSSRVAYIEGQEIYQRLLDGLDSQQGGLNNAARDFLVRQLKDGQSHLLMDSAMTIANLFDRTGIREGVFNPQKQANAGKQTQENRQSNARRMLDTADAFLGHYLLPTTPEKKQAAIDFQQKAQCGIAKDMEGMHSQDAALITRLKWVADDLMRLADRSEGVLFSREGQNNNTPFPSREALVYAAAKTLVNAAAEMAESKHQAPTGRFGR